MSDNKVFQTTLKVVPGIKTPDFSKIMEHLGQLLVADIAQSSTGFDLIIATPSEGSQEYHLKVVVDGENILNFQGEDEGACALSLMESISEKYRLVPACAPCLKERHSSHQPHIKLVH